MDTKVMVFKMPEEMHEALEEIGEREERTKAFLIRLAIKKFLEQNATNSN